MLPTKICLRYYWQNWKPKRRIEQVESTGSGPRRGRPPKGGEGKRASFNTRIRDSLKQQLERAAVHAGRSLSEEIEFRLERSFDTRPLFSALELAYGQKIAGLLLLIAYTIRKVESGVSEWELVWRQLFAENRWPGDIESDFSILFDAIRTAKYGQGFSDPIIYHHVYEAITLLLRALAPSPDYEHARIPVPDSTKPEVARIIQRVGEFIALESCGFVADPEIAVRQHRPPGAAEHLRLIHDLLGEELTERLKAVAARERPLLFGVNK